MRLIRLAIFFMLAYIISSALDNSAEAAEDSTAEANVIEAQRLIASDRDRDALELIRAAQQQFPANRDLIEMEAQLLFDMGRYADATIRIVNSESQTTTLQKISDAIAMQYEKSTQSARMAIIIIEKNIDLQDYKTAISIANLALEKFPEKQVSFLLLKGEALYKDNDLDAAEVELRKTLKIDPMNDIAKAYIEEIRTTQEAQQSTEVAEWISIAKDKLGDFVVTFLALFIAFAVNSLIDPLSLRLKLSRARKSFENGDYDDFTDLIEGLLDKENFVTLRTNFRIILAQKSYEETREILNEHVVTLERLPTLLRILEREYDKM